MHSYGVTWAKFFFRVANDNGSFGKFHRDSAVIDINNNANLTVCDVCTILELVFDIHHAVPDVYGPRRSVSVEIYFDVFSCTLHVTVDAGVEYRDRFV